MTKKKVLSLFSGCGGMDLGLEGGFRCLTKSVNEEMCPDWIEKKDGIMSTLVSTGFDTVFAVDIRPDAKRAWTDYFSGRKENCDGIYHLDSIVDLVKRAKAGERVFPEDIDIVTGGFPCNDFSVSGKRMGFMSSKSDLGVLMDEEKPTAENRGMLYMPKMFIAENVKGLTNLGEARQIIEHDFAEAGGGRLRRGSRESAQGMGIRSAPVEGEGHLLRVQEVRPEKGGSRGSFVGSGTPRIRPVSAPYARRRALPVRHLHRRPRRPCRAFCVL